MKSDGVSGCSFMFREMSNFSLTKLVVFISYTLALVSDFCSASPILNGDVSQLGGGHRLVRRAPPETNAPHEPCGDTTCNRVTHYCDEVISSCASCEDDCHPGRIGGDPVITEDCLKKCDWYYYIKSLTSDVTESPSLVKKEPDGPNVYQTDRAFMTVMIICICFTFVVVTLLAVFACIVKKLSARQIVVSQDTQGVPYKNRIWKPVSSSSLLGKRNPVGAETSIKSLDSSEPDSVVMRAGQQNSFRCSLYDQSLNLASAVDPTTSNQKIHTFAQVHTRGGMCRHPNHEDSSTCPLVLSNIH